MLGGLISLLCYDTTDLPSAYLAYVHRRDRPVQ